MPRSPGRYRLARSDSDFSAVIRSSQGSYQSDAQCALCEIPTHPPLGKQSETRTCFLVSVCRKPSGHRRFRMETSGRTASTRPGGLPDTLTNRPSRVKYTYIQMYRASRFPSRIQSLRKNKSSERCSSILVNAPLKNRAPGPYCGVLDACVVSRDDSHDT